MLTRLRPHSETAAVATAGKILRTDIQPEENGKAEGDWQPPSMIRAEVKLGIDDNVPPEYIEDLAQRLSLHQRLSWSNSVAEIQELRAELRDRYGPDT